MPNITTTLHAKPNAPDINIAPAIKATRAVQLRKLLIRKSGATIPQIQKSFNWQPHTARAAISRLRKAGDVIERQESSNGSFYRIMPVKAGS